MNNTNFTGSDQGQSRYLQYVKPYPAKTYPNRKQGIVYTALENIKLSDYIIATEDKVSPSNVFAASCISNNRIFIYLTVE